MTFLPTYSISNATRIFILISAIIAASCVKEEKYKNVTAGGFVLNIPSNYSIEKESIPLPDVIGYSLRNKKNSTIANISLLSIPNVSDEEINKLRKLENEIKMGKIINSCGIIYSRYAKSKDETYNISALGWHTLLHNGGSNIEYVQFESEKIDSNDFSVMRNILGNATCSP